MKPVCFALFIGCFFGFTGGWLSLGLLIIGRDFFKNKRQIDETLGKKGPLSCR